MPPSGVDAVPLQQTGERGWNAALLKAGLTILFMLFLVPVQLNQISMNYTFLLLPLFYFAATGKFIRPPAIFFLVLTCFALVFIVATTYQVQYLDQIARRFVSFALFLGVFSYIFMRITPNMVAAFKAAVVALSVLLSLQALYIFFISGGSEVLGFEAKDLVGSQRIGFVYLVAFWLVLLHRAPGKLYVLCRYGALLVLVAGLFLTFSRSSIISLFASLALYGAAAAWRWCRRPTFVGFARAIGILVALLGAIALLYALVPLVFDFFQTRLIVYLSDSQAMEQDFGDQHSSGGTRLFVWREILRFVSAHPLTGSGYLGVWILPGFGGDFVSSAHNQYADVFFRTGIVGLIAYAYLLFLLVRHLYRSHRGLFWGLAAVLVYGMFHETFKESQGAFILAFLLGMLAQAARDARSSAEAEARAVR